MLCSRHLMRPSRTSLPHQVNDLFMCDNVDYPTRPSLAELDRRVVFPDADDSQPYRIDIHIYASAFAALESLQDRPGAVPRLRTVFVDLLKYTHVDTI